MASRKEQKEKLRAEREAREREAAAGARRKRLIGYAVAGALGAAALVAIIVVAATAGGGDGGGNGGSSGGEARPTTDFEATSVPPRGTVDLKAAAQKAGCTVQGFKSEGSTHVPGKVKYKSNPAHSGNHSEIPIDDGFYVDTPAVENVVHSLEHGRIVVQYKPSTPNEIKAQIGALFKEDPYHVNVVPNPEMPYEVAAVAWTQVLGCKRASPQIFDAMRAFKERHRDRGPEFVP